uniref:Uncharacterized protein n=1 Tax=Vespula pensylvanica TaxID=30213 RepID=A0A834P2U0_VESPE|nr:hypothetical protein H0235_008305 [Vespula pensylvanica]
MVDSQAKKIQSLSFTQLVAGFTEKEETEEEEAEEEEEKEEEEEEEGERRLEIPIQLYGYVSSRAQK